MGHLCREDQSVGERRIDTESSVSTLAITHLT